MADALRSGRSVLTDLWVQIPPSAHAPVAQRIERSPAEAEVVGSNLTRRTIFGRLAQWLEHLLYTQGVSDSNPLSPTILRKVLSSYLQFGHEHHLIVYIESTSWLIYNSL